MEKNRNSAKHSNKEVVVNTIKPEFKKQNGEMVKFIDMSDEEVINAIDFLNSLHTRRVKETEKIEKLLSYAVLEMKSREGEHKTYPCAKQHAIQYVYGND